MLYNHCETTPPHPGQVYLIHFYTTLGAKIVMEGLFNQIMWYTGCILMILGKYQVTTLARNQPVSFEWCHLLILPSPFWYLISKNVHDLFSNYPYSKALEVHNCENMQNTLKIEEETSVCFPKCLCNESSNLYEIWNLSS